jgi:hypothetical protein
VHCSVQKSIFIQIPIVCLPQSKRNKDYFNKIKKMKSRHTKEGEFKKKIEKEEEAWISIHQKTKTSVTTC